MRKKNPKILNRIAFFYSAVFAFMLTGSGLTSGLTLQNIITTILFLPVSLFFVFELFSLFARTYQSTYKEEGMIPTKFSINTFLTQKDPVFILTIILFTAAISMTLLRLSINMILHDPNSTIALSEIVK